MKKIDAVVLSGIILSAAVCGAERANADVTYEYTGNSFDTFSFYGEPNPYTSSDKVTVTLKFDAPLGKNFSGVVTPNFFSFSDGAFSISDYTSYYNGLLHAYIPTVLPETTYFRFWTDGLGNIVNWDVEMSLHEGGLEANGYLITTIDLPSSVVDDHGRNQNIFHEADAYVYNKPGVWSVLGAPSAPEPSTWAMMLIGLVGLGFARHKRGRRRPIAA